MGSCPLGKSSMSEIVAFDTNVLLYAVDRHEPGKRDRALDLIARSDGAVMLWQVAIEFIAASRKLAARGMTPQEAWDQLRFYLAAMPLILPASTVLDRAKDMHLKRQMSFWDALVIAAAADAGATRLYSEDLPGAGVEGLQVINPFK